MQFSITYSLVKINDHQWYIIVISKDGVVMKVRHSIKGLAPIASIILQIVCMALLSNHWADAQGMKSKVSNLTNDTIRPEDKLRFLDSVNKYRIQKGVAPLVYSFHDDKLARYRVKTIYKHIDSISDQEYLSNYMTHLHYKFEKNLIAYDNKYIHRDSIITAAGECVARLDKMSLIVRSNLVNNIFQGWKNSQAHWKEMMCPDYTYIVLHWHIDKKREYDLQKGGIFSLVLFNKVLAKKRIDSLK
jgi:uncharacterized protein YkwD